jgi:hypothetical protein
MKNLTILICLWLIAGQVYTQIRPDPDPLLFRPATHGRNLKSTANPYNGKSFYQSKADWQMIIDTTWGPGLPLDEKLRIFDTYTNVLTEKYGCFNTLGINPAEWDSIKTSYRSRIDSTTSKGAFAALMSRLAYNFRDIHVHARDDSVLFTPLNPGTPILLIGSVYINHFGAVLTVLSDSSLVVLKVLDNHPLGLQPGDIVLGYEGVAWKDLVNELLGSGIPMFSDSRGAKSALRYHELASAGMNWHLFETIDIVKYTNGDTLHLPVYPLLNLPVADMWNTVQLPIPGVPFPYPDKEVTFGKVEGTNIGYIYIIWENDNTDVQFYEAVRSLMGTDGLIIDLRWNVGGTSFFSGGFYLLFNIRQSTITDADRCKPNDFRLCRGGYMGENYYIKGNPMSWYDKPIAILTGPGCFSGGDIVAYRFGYHPMSCFFGKSTGASLSYGLDFSGAGSGWDLTYSVQNFYPVNDPELFLSHREFPVDDPVWFDRDGVSKGEDAVVNNAMEWIQNVSYAHEAKANPWYILPGEGEVTLTAKVENSNGRDLAVNAFITSMDSTIKETISLIDDGNHGDGDPGNGIWGTVWQVPEIKAIFSADLSTEDPAAGTTRKITSAVRFTNIGPVVVERITYSGSDTIPNAGDNILFKVVLRNNDLTTAVDKIRVKLNSPDTTLAKTSDFYIEYPNIAPGEISTNIGFMPFNININDDCPSDTTIPVKVEILSDYYTFWTDTIPFLVHGPSNMKEMNTLQARVYPNPAEDRINIEIDNSGSQETVVELVTVTGTVIYHREYRNSQDHFAGQIDVSDYARGMYFVRIRQGSGMYNEKIVLGR